MRCWLVGNDLVSGLGANGWKIRHCSDICGSANLAEPKGRTGGQEEDSKVVLYAAAWSCPVIHRLARDDEAK